VTERTLFVLGEGGAGQLPKRLVRIAWGLMCAVVSLSSTLSLESDQKSGARELHRQSRQVVTA